VDELGAFAVAAQRDDDARTAGGIVVVGDGEAAGQRVEAGQGARQGRSEAVDDSCRCRCRGLGQEQTLLDVVHRDHTEIPRRQVHGLLRLRLRRRRAIDRLWPDETPGDDPDGAGQVFFFFHFLSPLPSPSSCDL
jgi:hypothetical protein